MASALSSPRLAALALLSAWMSQAQTPAILQPVRHSSGSTYTKVVLETTVEVRHRSQTLSDPERLYVDLLDARLGDFKGMGYSVPVEDGIVRQIRVAQRENGIIRVVLDLGNEAGNHLITALAAPARIVIEVKRSGLAPPPVPRVEVSSVPSEPARVWSPGKVFVPPPSKPYPKPPAFLFKAARLPEFAPAPRLPEPGWVLSRAMTPLMPPAAVSAPKTASATKVVSARVKDLEPVPLPAAQDRFGNRSLTRVLGLKLNRVVLDAGHGGYDTGTIARSGLMEKDVVLDVTLRLGQMLEERLGTEVIYTREDDTFVALEKRTEIANENKADLFLSIHANSSPYRSILGTETFYLNFTSTKADLDVAARENASSQMSIHDLQDVIRKIALRDKLDESREFATRIQSSAYEMNVQANGKLRNRGIKKAPFVVLIGASMPSVLTEIGFLSNPKEEGLMGRPEHRQKVAEALYKGIVKYAESLSRLSVAQRRPDPDPVVKSSFDAGK